MIRYSPLLCLIVLFAVGNIAEAQQAQSSIQISVPTVQSQTSVVTPKTSFPQANEGQRNLLIFEGSFDFPLLLSGNTEEEGDPFVFVKNGTGEVSPTPNSLGDFPLTQNPTRSPLAVTPKMPALPGAGAGKGAMDEEEAPTEEGNFGTEPPRKRPPSIGRS